MKSSQPNKWKCKGCGRCCKIFKLPVSNREELLKLFEETYGFKLKDPIVEALFHGECEHLKNNKCTNYENRPDVCKEYYCKLHTALEVPDQQIYQKRCLICNKIRKFQKGTERDKQSVCGNCWVW